MVDFRKGHRALVAAGLSVMVALTACEPEPLSGLEPDEDVFSYDDVGHDTAAPGDEDTNIPDEDVSSGAEAFPQIANIIRTTCAIGGCHAALGGPSLGGNFSVEGGTEATLEQIRASLEGVDAVSGTPLVDPGNPEGSELYRLLVIDDQNLVMPKPPVPALAPQQIDLIYDWIASGAPYE